jgi:hypothetical protein
MSERFYLTQDNDGHWYVVPVAMRDRWNAWLQLDEDDERAWNVPEWALRTYGAPSLVTFEAPNIEIQ